jgi:hypothetical protein
MNDPSWPQAWVPISYTEDAPPPQVRAGGKPKTNTPADKRLKENKQPPKPTASRSTMPKVTPKTPKRK